MRKEHTARKGITLEQQQISHQIGTCHKTFENVRDKNHRLGNT